MSARTYHPTVATDTPVLPPPGPCTSLPNRLRTLRCTCAMRTASLSPGARETTPSGGDTYRSPRPPSFSVTVTSRDIDATPWLRYAQQRSIYSPRLCLYICIQEYICYVSFSIIIIIYFEK